MKTMIAALAAATLIVGCASTPKAPRSVEEAGIKPGDSKALTLMKLVDLERNLYDVEVGDKFEEGGFGIGNAVVLGSAGYNGVGLVNAAGLSGAMGTIGLGWLMSGSGKPAEHFYLIISEPAGESRSIEQVVTSALKASGVTVEAEPFREGRLLRLAGDKKSVIDVFPAITAGNLGSSLDGLSGDRSYYALSMSYGSVDMIISAMSNVTSVNSFVYVPAKSGGSLNNPVSSKYVSQAPYLIDLGSRRILPFAKSQLK